MNSGGASGDNDLQDAVNRAIDRVKEREDPFFDYRAELDSMLELWREEIPCHGDRGYNGAAT